MGRWATISGQVVVPKDKHLSLNKLVENFFDGEDYSLGVYKPSTFNGKDYHYYTYNLEINCEVDGYLAWEMFSTFKEVLTEGGCKCDFRARIDL